VLPEVTVVDTVPSWYCHDLVTAMVQLLRKATAEDAATPHDKFVFVSDSTLPVKPPHVIRSTLMADDQSDICVFPSSQWGQARGDGTHSVTLVKHHQWVVLNRAHAERMVAEWQPVQADGHWVVPLQRNTQWNSHPPYSAKWFHRPWSSNWCTDEWAFFTTLFGAPVTVTGLAEIAVPGFSGGTLALTGPRAQNAQGTCRTFAYWSGDSPDFRSVANVIGSDVPNTRVSCWPTCNPRPMSFQLASANALLALRSSGFLFARKFDPGSVALEDFRSIVLADTPPSVTTTPPPPPQSTPRKAVMDPLLIGR